MFVKMVVNVCTFQIIKLHVFVHRLLSVSIVKSQFMNNVVGQLKLNVIVSMVLVYLMVFANVTHLTLDQSNFFN